MGIYDDVNLNLERFIILSEQKQDVPTGTFRVIAEAMQKANNGKTEFPVLTLEDKDGNRLKVAAWARDVRKCIEEYGTDTTSWRVAFERHNGRLVLVPSQPLDVEKIA